jgi:predicted alpha/beta hydrolase family esterase
VAKKVLLVSGFQNKKFDARSKWHKLAGRLEEAGCDVLVSDYGHGEPTKDSISNFGRELAREIRAFRPDVIIAHSMGCLVTRWAVEQMKCGYPGLKLILIEGPHEGLPNKGFSFGWVAVKIFETIKRLPDRSVPDWDSWKEMQEDSGFLNQLNLSGLDNHRTKLSYYEIGGLFAHFLPETFSLPNAIDCTGKRIFPRVTHSGLKTNSEVAAYILKIIES